MKMTISVKFRMIASRAITVSNNVLSTAKAQDKVEASVGADFVSNYIWRGTDCGGVSVQPSTGSQLTRACHSTAWGSVGIRQGRMPERSTSHWVIQYRRFQRIRYRLLVLLPQVEDWRR